MIGDHRRREESGHFEPAVAVRRTHHGNLDAHVAQSSDAICPVSFNRGAPLELEAKFREELDGGIDVFYQDADVVHALDRHHVSLAANVMYLEPCIPTAPVFVSRRRTASVARTIAFPSGSRYRQALDTVPCNSAKTRAGVSGTRLTTAPRSTSASSTALPMAAAPAMIPLSPTP